MIGLFLLVLSIVTTILSAAVNDSFEARLKQEYFALQRSVKNTKFVGVLFKKSIKDCDDFASTNKFKVVDPADFPLLYGSFVKYWPFITKVGFGLLVKNNTAYCAVYPVRDDPSKPVGASADKEYLLGISLEFFVAVLLSGRARIILQTIFYHEFGHIIYWLPSNLITSHIDQITCSLHEGSDHFDEYAADLFALLHLGLAQYYNLFVVMPLFDSFIFGFKGRIYQPGSGDVLTFSVIKYLAQMMGAVKVEDFLPFDHKVSSYIGDFSTAAGYFIDEQCNLLDDFFPSGGVMLDREKVLDEVARDLEDAAECHPSLAARAIFLHKISLIMQHEAQCFAESEDHYKDVVYSINSSFYGSRKQNIHITFYDKKCASEAKKSSMQFSFSSSFKSFALPIVSLHAGSSKDCLHGLTVC